MKPKKLYYKYDLYTHNEYKHPYIAVWGESYDHGLPKNCERELFTVEGQTDRQCTSPYGIHAKIPISWTDSRGGIRVLASLLNSLNGNNARGIVTWLHKNHATRIIYNSEKMEYIPYSARKYPGLYFEAKKRGLKLNK